MSEQIPAVIFENKEFLVLNKPSGWHSVIGKGDARGERSVEKWLRQRDSEAEHLPEAGLIHRLDRGTSGCLVVAKTFEASGVLQEQLRNGGIDKRYLAVTSGRLRHRKGEFVLHFNSRYKGSKKVKVTKDGDHTVRGRCRWWKLEDYDPGPGRSVVEVDLQGPGRRHQVRAGLAFLGAPLIGDELYGGPEGDRMMLHAWWISVEGRRIEAPVPESFGPHVS
jgi:23S rRNA-/tRNA-specific pseudouridylate synthase